MLSQWSVQMQKDYVCLLDYTKAFDIVQYKATIEMLELLDIDGNEIDLIISLYWDQLAALQIDGTLSEWIEIDRSLRRGCNKQISLHYTQRRSSKWSKIHTK